MADRGPDDLKTVRAVLAGDSEAFADLVRRYQKLVASVAWRYGVRQHEVEDVVSEVFFKVYRNLHQFRPEHAFSTWLYRLAANHVLDHGRRVRREGDRAELPVNLQDPGPDPGEQADAIERAELLRSAMDDVPQRYREALFLVYIEGMRVEDAARTLGVPQGTVKSRLLRGRKALREILGRRHPETFGGDDAMS